MYQIIRGKELAKNVGINIESNAYQSKYPWEIAKKHLGQHAIKISRNYDLELEDIHIGPIPFIPTILVLIMPLLVCNTRFSFHADIYCNAETPVYFHPSPIENGVPSVPWGYFSHDSNSTSDGKDDLMEPDLNASDDWCDVYRSTLAGVDAVV